MPYFCIVSCEKEFQKTLQGKTAAQKTDDDQLLFNNYS